MKNLLNGYSRKAGLAPGTIVHIGDRKTERPKITLINYDQDSFEEKVAERIEDCFEQDRKGVTWINVDGIHQIDIIEKLGKHLELHPLVMEDILHTDQRPKIEDYESYIYLVLKMLRYDDIDNDIKAEQVSLVLGRDFVVSFQEVEGDTFNAVRKRLRTSKGRIRSMDASYLAYALMDSIVDNYFVVLERVSEIIETLEDELIQNPVSETLEDIHDLKKEIIYFRKSVWPLREVISGLERTGPPLIADTTQIYLKDIYDHTIRVAESIETYRDIITGVMDLYLSSISNKMNEVMKTLTIIATIFIPLTFVAGVYGMNFEYMPELEWKWGYPAVWIIMIMVSAAMVMYFRNKKWL
ncbi:magnesium/cobalt transporter CorA [Methanolobus halotolerans]|uniref:Magnesium transport protein CorA n=1 Tax=Methanolobus halotolerans TaxID=2052935 RepID=A0A4E0PZ01_9EURY|nr:magnesium/cobalt transporter CorA [Methanolobus halotolerans]TGC11538.1 magnesium and cobalt transport protein CorA [Methanolobus halotolerans]